MKFRSLLAGLVPAFLALALTAAQAADAPSKIRVGVRSGPGAQIAEVAAKVAARSGLTVVPVVIDGLGSPNDALHDGDIEANAFQHDFYLAAENSNKHYNLVSTVPLYNSPLAIYSVRHKSLDEIPQGGLIALPQDDANLNRALRALEYNGLIKLRPGLKEGDSATLLDVAQNPRKLKFKQIAVTVLPRVLQDFDAGAVSATHAYRVANIPLDQAIAKEDPRVTAAYDTKIVVRPADKNTAWVRQLETAFQSPEVKAFVQKEFGSSITVSF